MASAVYPLARQSFLTGEIVLTTDTIKVVLLSATYTYSATHQFYNDLSGVIQASPAMSSKVVTNGTFSAANSTLTAVAGGSTITALAGYQDTGVVGTSRLIWFNDGFSQLTNGGTIIVQWDTGANKIFVI